MLALFTAVIMVCVCVCAVIAIYNNRPCHCRAGMLSGSFTYHFLVETEWLGETELGVEQSAFL